MQNWSPETFADTGRHAVTESTADWHPEQKQPATGAESLFRKDTWGRGPGKPRDLLTREEREALQRQVEEEVTAAHRQQLEEARIELRQENTAWLTHLGAEIQSASDRKLQDIARNTGQLALALAERVLRRAIRVDPDILFRALEVLLRKVEADAGLELRVNPADAELLEASEDLKRQLHLDRIIPDRRIERGGCLVRAGRQMWDATLRGQIEALTEVVDEIMAAENLAKADDDDGTDQPLA